MKANCPSCGAEVQFKSSISVFSVCEYCRSMIVRHDMDLEALGKMAQLPDDLSPLKIGSRGKYNRTNFEVIGRLKVAWSEGYWNEWFVLFENGRSGWLAEAMGFFMLSAEVKETGKVPSRKEVKVGESYELLPQKKFTVHDIKDAECIGSEGELPFSGLKGRKTVSVDLSDQSGEFANIEYSEQDGTRLYLGKYLDFDSLEWTDLRDLTADMKKVRSSELFKCPSCGGPITLLAPGHTASIACSYCASIIDTTNRHLAILQKAEKKMTIKPLLPIGKKGRLYGIEWEVIGFLRRADPKAEYPWDEYLLYNPRKGFRWLTTYNGHWNFVEMLHTRPEGHHSRPSVQFRGRPFTKFLAGKAKVLYVLGEFYWRIKRGDTVEVKDFIAPPEMLSLEKESSEYTWSLGRYMDPQEIEKAFMISDGMPPKTGVAPNQPSPYEKTFPGFMTSYVIFLTLITALQFFFVFTAKNKVVYADEFVYGSGGAGAKTIVTPAFDLPGSSDNVAVELYSPVSNDWMEISADLVNDDTQKGIEFEEGVEFYHGFDSDGQWVEGKRTNDILLSSVPGGRYHLVIQPASSGGWSTGKFSLKVHRGVAIWSNYFIGLLMLSLYPLWVLWRKRVFEMKRWSESDFNPYEKEE
jgi:hypothetical protein